MINNVIVNLKILKEFCLEKNITIEDFKDLYHGIYIEKIYFLDSIEEIEKEYKLLTTRR